MVSWHGHAERWMKREADGRASFSCILCYSSGLQPPTQPQANMVPLASRLRPHAALLALLWPPSGNLCTRHVPHPTPSPLPSQQDDTADLHRLQDHIRR
jgi:hypothetical protein